MEQKHPAAQDAPQANFKGGLWPLFFLPAALIYHELLLRLCAPDAAFWGMPLIYILLFSAAAGLAAADSGYPAVAKALTRAGICALRRVGRADMYRILLQKLF